MTGDPADPMAIAVTGAAGRMGRAVIESAMAHGHEVVVAVNRSEEPEVEGIPVEPSSELLGLLDAHRPDVLVDFTGPESSVRYVQHCAAVGVPAVVGTTGFDDEQLAVLTDTSETIPVLQAANFARGIQALGRAIEAAVAALPGYDVEVVEIHHNRKRDAPSGTARELLDRIDSVRGETERVHGREGESPRTDGEVGVHSLRAGDVTGEHEVVVASNHELVTLGHRAENRGVYAAGALDAADWLRDSRPGFYTFEDVIG